ncbi:MAG: hypothetical protein ACI4XD_05075 [Clostridia bacterium]|jgi:hypothetical protein
MFLYGGTSNSDAALSDWFKRINGEEIMIMPNVFNLLDISYVPYTGRIIEMENDDNFTELENILKQEGLGKMYSIEQLKQNAFYNIYDLNSELIYQFIIITIFIIVSIGGYNTLEVLNYRRILTIYYINGLEWEKGVRLIGLKNFVMIIIPAIITSIICTNSLSVTNQVPFDWRVVFITTLIYVILYFTTTIGTILNLKKIKPVEVLKEVD